MVHENEYRYILINWKTFAKMICLFSSYDFSYSYILHVCFDLKNEIADVFRYWAYFVKINNKIKHIC